MTWFRQGPGAHKARNGRAAFGLIALSVTLSAFFSDGLLASRALAQSSLNPEPEPGQTTREPSWHPGAALTFTGGAVFMPSDQANKWKKRQPMHVQVHQTFNLAEPAGEFNLGAGILYDAGGGSAERAIGAAGEKETKDVGYYTFGLVAAADYRLAVNPRPVVAPRFGVFAGVGMQSQKTLLDTFETKSEQFYKPLAGVRAHVELSLLALNPSERGAIAYGYGVEDFVLIAGTTYFMDLSPRKSYKIGGYTLEGGLGFLLP